MIASMRAGYVARTNGFAPLAAANADRPHLALEFTQSLLALRRDVASDVLATIFAVYCFKPECCRERDPSQQQFLTRVEFHPAGRHCAVLDVARLAGGR